MNQQREATGRVIQEAARLAQSYGELQKVLGEMKNVARDHVLIGTRLANAEERLAEFAKELQILSVPATTTNDVPGLVPEPPGTPQP
jgi:hypothetical protein